MNYLQTLRSSLTTAGLAAVTTIAGASQVSAQSSSERQSSTGSLATELIPDAALKALQFPSEAVSSKSVSAAIEQLGKDGAEISTVEMLAADLLNEPLVLSAALPVMGRSPMSVPRALADRLLSSDTFVRHVFNTPMTEYLVKSRYLWHNLLSACSPESATELLPRVAGALAPVWSAQDGTIQREFFLNLVPPLLRSEPALREAFANALNRSPESVPLLSAADSFGVSSGVIFDRAASLLRTTVDENRTLLAGFLVRHMTESGLAANADLHPVILNSLRKEPSLWPTGALLRSESFTGMITKEVGRDPDFIKHIPRSVWSRNSSELNQQIRDAMLEKVGSIEKKLFAYLALAQFAPLSCLEEILNVPLILLENPANRQFIRSVCSQELVAVEVFPASIRPAHRPFISDLFREIPEILRMTGIHRAFSGLSPTEVAELVKINPGAFDTIMPRTKPLPDAGLQALINTRNALSVLGIDDMSRFDNAREVIRNRYALADEVAREQLEELMTPEYFDGVESDTRPCAIIVCVDPGVDHNGAFDQVNDLQGRDYVDRLTDHYRVLFFEGSGNTSAVDFLTSVRDRFGVKAEVLMILGHGSPDGVTLGGKRFNASEVEQLAGLMQPKGAILLGACSSGGDAGPGVLSLHSAFRSVFPQCRVVAPTSTVALPELMLTEEGVFKKLTCRVGVSIEGSQQRNADKSGIFTLEYDPDTQMVTSKPAYSLTDFAVTYLTRRTLPVLPLLGVTFLSGVAAEFVRRQVFRIVSWAAKKIYRARGPKSES